MTPFLACTGHLLVDLPLFGLPILLLGGAVLWIVRADRRQGREDSGLHSGDAALATDDLREQLGELAGDSRPRIVLAGDAAP
jgi:hypothetical protein